MSHFTLPVRGDERDTESSDRDTGASGFETGWLACSLAGALLALEPELEFELEFELELESESELEPEEPMSAATCTMFPKAAIARLQRETPLTILNSGFAASPRAISFWPAATACEPAGEKTSNWPCWARISDSPALLIAIR